MDNRLVGKELAYFYLVKCGHKVLLRDYECPLGMIDVVSKHDGVLVFSEVLTDKQRSSKKMETATKYYLKRYGIQAVPVRFNTVRVSFKDGAEPVITNKEAGCEI